MPFGINTLTVEHTNSVFCVSRWITVFRVRFYKQGSFLIWKMTVFSTCCIFICNGLVYLDPHLRETVAVTELSRHWKYAFLFHLRWQQPLIYDLVDELACRKGRDTPAVLSRSITLLPSSPLTSQWYLTSSSLSSSSASWGLFSPKYASGLTKYGSTDV